MSDENYDHILYFDCPHFPVGRPDQWGEHGYLLYGGKVYWYEEDRKDQCVRLPMTPEEFLIYARERPIAIPDDFMDSLMKIK